MSIFGAHPILADDAARECLDTLIDLHTRTADTLHGFRKMAEKAKPAFRQVAEGFGAIHSRHAARLDKIDEGVMRNIRSGEESAIAAFDRALQASVPKGHLQALTQMRAELPTMLEDTRTIG